MSVNETKDLQPQFILASRSPRRKELLAQLGLRFQSIDADIDESVLADESPQDYVVRVALAKAIRGWHLLGKAKQLPVLGSDTTVVIHGEILGKPKNQADSARMLTALSGQTHQVITAVAIVLAEQKSVELVTTEVSFDHIDAATMARYWLSGEPLDKAGSYAIQGLGGLFVRRISGSYTAVVGLPVFQTARLLADFGVVSL